MDHLWIYTVVWGVAVWVLSIGGAVVVKIVKQRRSKPGIFERRKLRH